MSGFLESSDSESEVTLTINKDYANRYNNWRQKEEFQKLKDRYGEEVLKETNDDSNTSEEEDEDAKELTKDVEKDFFKTLSCLKKRDPRIYDGNVQFFNANKNSEEIHVSNKKEKKEPVFLRDYERKLIVERGGIVSDDDEDDDHSKVRPSSPTLVEEQKTIKDSFKNVIENSDEEEAETNWGGLFKQRMKSKEEIKNEDEVYREWLKGQKDELPDKNVETDLKYLHDYWNDPNLDSSEAYLRDYILNKKFLDPTDKEHIPSYNEIVHDSSEDFSEDERTFEKQEEFEHKYNFRFEEPDQEFIKRYPRTMETSLRKKDDRRKRKRQDVKERKELEKEVKREEIKQLKALKRNEILEKIEKLKFITGNTDLGFKDEDLEEEFNPEEYDKRMKEVFNDDYYGIEETDDKKPKFPDLDEELEIENWNEWDGGNTYNNEQEENYYNGPHCEDPDFNMDCDYDPKAALEKELTQSMKGKKKNRRKQSKFAEVLAKSKPTFNPTNQTFDEYVEEYYKLDCEDIIGDLPCRFKYRKVISNNFGLTVDEILKADDKELNKWCSLKKSIQYRPENMELYDVQAYKKKSKNENLKRRTLTSLYFENQDEEEKEETPPNKKRKLVKEEKSETTGTKDAVEREDTTQKRKKKKKKMKSTLEHVQNTNTTNENNADNNLDAHDATDDVVFSVSSTVENKIQMKKRKKKNIQQIPSLNYVENSNPENETIDHKSTLSDFHAESGTIKNSAEHKIQVKKKRKKKKKNKGESVNTNHTNEVVDNSVEHKHSFKIKNHKKKFNMNLKRRHHLLETQKPETVISDARLKAYGINPKKFKNKLIYGKKKS